MTLACPSRPQTAASEGGAQDPMTVIATTVVLAGDTGAAEGVKEGDGLQVLGANSLEARSVASPHGYPNANPPG